MKTAEQWRVKLGHLPTMPVHPSFFQQGVIEKIQKDATALLRKALADLVGADGEDELNRMEILLRTMPAPEKDRASMINAIHALRDTLHLKTT